MGFLDRLLPPPREEGSELRGGVRASATIERVALTDRTVRREGLGAGAGDGSAHPIVAVTFSVTEPDGATTVCERRREFPTAHIPAPGTTVPILYTPGMAAATIDVVRGEADKPATDLWEPPDPSVPRGWSGGVFEVEGLGSEGRFPPSGHGIEADRELFRNGRRATAKIVASANTGEMKETAWERVIKLLVEDREIEVIAWTPEAIWPDAGDQIEVALDSDGSKLALDTDERWDGLPGRALVFKAPAATATPPAGSGESPAPDSAASASDPGGLLATLDQQLAEMKMSRIAMGRRYEKTIRKILDGYKRTGVLDEAGYDERLQRALD